MFPCPRCGRQVQCDTGYAGTQINCPACHQAIVVPRLPQVAAAPSAPFKSKAWRNVLITCGVVIVLAGLIIGGLFVYNRGPYYVVSGAGSATANGKYHLMDPSPTQGFWGGREGTVWVNDKRTAYLGINQQCYIWVNDHSANPAAAQALYMIYSTNPTDRPWNVNAGKAPAPTVTYHP